MLTLKTGAMMLKIQLCITEINYIWKYIETGNIFLMQLFFYNINVLLYFHQINATLVSYKTVKHKQILIISNF